MKQYTEDELQRALAEVRGGCPIREAARKWGIPYQSLQHRYHRRQSRNAAFIHRQHLSQIQEDKLAAYICLQASLGRPINHQQVKGLAERMMGDGQRRIGKKWMRRFLRRNPSIGTRRSRAIDARRWAAHQPEVIQDFFHRLGSITAIQDIHPSNRWNMDETGIMEGKGANRLVLGSAASRYIQKKAARIPGMDIYHRSIQTQWFPSNLSRYDGWHFTYSNNGWTTDRTALEWLEKVFIPGTMPEDPDAARLLVLDAHQSHISVDFMWKCWQHQIYLLFLPPHSSAVLQPLDVAVFGPLKQAYRKEVRYLDDWITDSTIAGKRAFLECYLKAREASITIQNIKAGWKATGLWPVSIRRPLSSSLVTKAQQTSQQTSQPSSQQWDEAVSIVSWSTPRKSANLRHHFHQIDQLVKDRLDIHTFRHLSRKVQKAYNKEAQLEDHQSRKRKKVPLSPNSTFAKVGDVQQPENPDAGRIDSPDESSASELSSEAESCIWVGGKPEEISGDSGGDDGGDSGSDIGVARI
ncbi:putative transposase [Colletotrichum sublineola]|uniref:Putative transposase n=1 Tax=Colletotrichum sublineola TaxID=1173701 RepID=A0A066XLN0_COLSU|nr:putative transposase [Colletotrichum sublineola]